MRGALHPNQRPLPLQLLSMQYKLEVALLQSALRVPNRLPLAKVPHHDGPAAVLSLWNCSFKTAVFHRVVFHLYCKPFVARVVAGPLRDCPALEDTMPTQPEVVVQLSRGGLLNDERHFLRGPGNSTCVRTPARLRSDIEVAHGAIALQLAIDSLRNLRLGSGLCGHQAALRLRLLDFTLLGFTRIGPFLGTDSTSRSRLAGRRLVLVTLCRNASIRSITFARRGPSSSSGNGLFFRFASRSLRSAAS